jgi:hypothetical protein
MPPAIAGQLSVSKQASGLALPADLVPLHLQQLLWLQEVHAPVQVAHAPGPPMPCGQQMVQAHQLSCSMGTLNLLLRARSLPPHAPVGIRLQALLFYGTRRPSLPLFLTSREPSLPHQRARMPDGSECSVPPQGRAEATGNRSEARGSSIGWI